jgi:Cu/Zn superoxide dismutase
MSNSLNIFILECSSSGSHFNPLNSTHGNISDVVRHVGDYGNVKSDANGLINQTIIDSFSSLYGPFGNKFIFYRNTS